MYLVYLLYTVAKQDYVIVYFNTLTNGNNRPSMSWIRDVYSVLEYKYNIDNLGFYLDLKFKGKMAPQKSFTK